jgi:hypothetical protein
MLGNTGKGVIKTRLCDSRVLLMVVRSTSARRQDVAENAVYFYIPNLGTLLTGCSLRVFKLCLGHSGLDMTLQ